MAYILRAAFEESRYSSGGRPVLTITDITTRRIGTHCCLPGGSELTDVMIEFEAAALRQRRGSLFSLKSVDHPRHPDRIVGRGLYFG